MVLNTVSIRPYKHTLYILKNLKAAVVTDAAWFRVNTKAGEMRGSSPGGGRCNNSVQRSGPTPYRLYYDLCPPLRKFLQSKFFREKCTV